MQTVVFSSSDDLEVIGANAAAIFTTVVNLGGIRLVCEGSRWNSAEEGAISSSMSQLRSTVYPGNSIRTLSGSPTPPH